MDGIEVDRLRYLPDSLLVQILLYLRTKDVVKTSLLSTQWKNLWRYVPALDLNRFDFSKFNAFVSFVDNFLRFNRDTLLQKFMLECNYYWEGDDLDHIKRWVNTVVEQKKLQHLHVSHDWYIDFVKMPSTIYTCESLVSLKLRGIILPSLKFVTLPSLKVMDLTRVSFSNKLVLEKLISHCPVLESLYMTSSFHDGEEVLRVCSHSLLSFRYAEHDSAGVAIDAPRLEYLSLDDNKSDVIILNNSASLVKVDINVEVNMDSGKLFDPKTNVFRKFLLGISSVKDMTMSSSTLEVLYDHSIWWSIPLFHNLSFLRVQFGLFGVELLPLFLKSCPNLKSLFVRFETYLETETDDIQHGSSGLLASLEYVEIGKPYQGKKMMMKLVAYLLDKSTNLKKLTISLGDSKEQEESVILEELISIPRVSNMCQVVVR